jgi:hypothetical protein
MKGCADLCPPILSDLNEEMILPDSKRSFFYAEGGKAVSADVLPDV